MAKDIQTNDLVYYFSLASNELIRLREESHTGSVSFQFNFKDGNLVNMQAKFDKSFKYQAV